MIKPIKFTFQLIVLLVAVASSGCFPTTKAVLKASKGPKDYKIKSVDSAFLTDQNYAIVYTTVSLKGKEKVQKAVFRVQKTGEGSSPSSYTPYAAMSNDTYKIDPQGNIVKRFKITTQSSEIFDGSGDAAILTEGNLPNKRILLSVYAYPDLPDWGRYAIALLPQEKTRRPYLYALTPATVATDVALTTTAVGVGIVAGAVILIGRLF